MKKITVLVATILAVLQSKANRNGNNLDANLLILSPSHSSFNHSSHYSHSSSSFSIQHDSIYNVTPDIIKMSKEGIKFMYEHIVSKESGVALYGLKKSGKITANQYKKIAKSLKQGIIVEIELSRIYISSHNEIIKSFNNEVIFQMNPEDKCLFISYEVKGISRSSTPFQIKKGEMIIPLSSENTIFYQINEYQNCVIEGKWNWMNNIIQKITNL